MPGIAVRNLRKAFDDLVVLDDISFSVGDGEFCVLLGPSGCGKTTMLRILAGLELQDRGAVRFGDEDVGDLSPKERDVSMVFQSYALYPHLSVFDNLAFPLKARKRPSDEIQKRVEEAAALLGITPLLGRKPRALSGGQRQRVAIGRAIVRSPRVFLFDEPLSNLDASLRAEMRLELARLHRELGTTVVYVTHDQVEAMTLGEKIVLLHDGAIQQVGTPADLYQAPANLFVAGFIGSPTMNLLEGELALRDDEVAFRSRELAVPIGGDSTGSWPIGEPVTLGIRPEAIEPGEGPYSARLEYFEDLGAEVLVYLEMGESTLVARAAKGWRSEVGAEVSFSLDGPALHLFHDEERLERDDAS